MSIFRFHVFFPSRFDLGEQPELRILCGEDSVLQVARSLLLTSSPLLRLLLFTVFGLFVYCSTSSPDLSYLLRPPPPPSLCPTPPPPSSPRCSSCSGRSGRRCSSMGSTSTSSPGLVSTWKAVTLGKLHIRRKLRLSLDLGRRIFRKMTLQEMRYHEMLFNKTCQVRLKS